MISIRIKGKFFNYTLFSCHATTEMSVEQTKEEYYDLLERCSRGVLVSKHM